MTETLLRPQLHIHGWPATLGFQIWKMLSDLQIIFDICELVRNVPIVLVASAMDAIGLQARYGKIKLLDFSVNGLQILSVIDIHNSSVYHSIHVPLHLESHRITVFHILTAVHLTGDLPLTH